MLKQQWLSDVRVIQMILLKETAPFNPQTLFVKTEDSYVGLKIVSASLFCHNYSLLFCVGALMVPGVG